MQEILTRITEKKHKLDSFRPLPSALVKNLDAWLAIEFTYTSNAIEGNTLSRDETALVVEKGLTIGGKTINEHLEAVNHMQAIDFIKLLVDKKRQQLDIHDILSIHKIVLQKIDDVNAGSFRRVSVRISGSTTTFPNYLKVPDLMDEFEQWLHDTKEHPAHVAALAHLKLVSIHPFVDGNGRTSRLLMNLLLLQEGYPFAIIQKEDRSKYIKAVEKAVQTNNYDDFLIVVFEAIENSLDIYLEAIEQSEI